VDAYEHPKIQRFMIWMRKRVPDISEQPNAMEAGDPNLQNLSPLKQIDEQQDHHISYKVHTHRGSIFLK
jgi:hypothetical protein